MEYKKTFITFGIVLVSMAYTALPAHAEEIVVTVSDNGAGASNEVNVTSQSQTTVNQNNTANIENNITTNANTGNNSANENTGGDTIIATGDVATNTDVSNQNINQNIAQASNPGAASGSISVSGNGANTTNSVNVSSTNTTTVSQNNTANITNKATTNANTGNNSADWNSGNVIIHTGSITATTNIENKNVNNSIAKILGGCDKNCTISQEMILQIFGNGAGSVNNLVFTANDSKTYTSSNLANIYNDAVHNLNTGGNSANGNNGDVTILSGDIDSTINITNEVNSNYVEVECGCKENPEQPTTPPTKPTPNGGSGGNGGGGNGGPTSGDVLGAAIGEVLPATGSLFILWATVASLILFFSGWYLRFRSGCAPGIAR
jgi:hypothetical protein